MSLTGAMFTGFTGISGNTVSVNTVGNNLANLNTTAFKSQRTLFETLLYRTIHVGEPPSATSGGTLPEQIGTGMQVASMPRDFRQGGLDATGFQSDLAVQGDGFFILNAATGERVFTRDGAFHLNSEQTFVAANGSPVQVFLANAEGNIDTSSLGDLVIPLGTASQALPTSVVRMDGRLDPATTVAAAGAVITSQPLTTLGGGIATESTPLTNLVNDNGIPLFAVGDELVINAQKGGVALQESVFVVGATGSTVGEFAGFLETMLGINADPAFGGSPGVRVSAGLSPAAGSLMIESNVGEINAVQLGPGAVVNRTGAVQSPFDFGTVSTALGPGVTTTFGVFDSLGQQIDVRLRFSLESKTPGGTTWRFFAESQSDSDLSPMLGTGTIMFGPDGQFLSATGTNLSIDRVGIGSGSPLTLNLDVTGLTGLAGPDGASEVIMASQNGAPAGLMTNYSIDRDGIVTAVYSNQQEQVLGQIALATFVNDEGLVARSENVYVAGPNSGPPTIVAPQSFTAGAVISGALEQSNVEIAREFITLIEASTGISAASRVVRAADDLLQELLLLAR